MKPLLSSLCALLVLCAAPAWADLSRDDAAAAAQRASGGGRVLAVEKSDVQGHAVWRVKVVTAQGEVRVILIDAATGRQL
ncbi:MAG: PepSY domain-containing protein [Ramlibacter sp.]